MDIQITGAEQVGKWILISSTRDGQPTIMRMPKETLAIRAAEYDLTPDDPRVLDMVLLEGLYQPEDPDEVHPLYSEATVADALATMEERIEQVRNEHGSPKEPQMRSLFHAADLDASTQGLTDAKRVLLEHADPEIMGWVRYNRDTNRHQITNDSKSLTEVVKNQAMGTIIEEAKLENMQVGRTSLSLESSVLSGKREPHVSNRSRR